MSTQRGTGGEPSQPHRAVSAAYPVALGLVAALNLLGFFVTGRVIDRYYLDAPLINQAGRQRMLSQKIAKEALHVALHQRDNGGEAELRGLAADFSDWSAAHLALGRGEEGPRLLSPRDGELEARYREVDRAFTAMAEPVREILGKAPGRGAPEVDAELRRVADASSEYLAHMDALVGLYEREARRRIDRLRWIQTGLLAAVLGLLGAEALLIFRPLVRRVRRAFEDLEAETAASHLSEERLRLAAEAAQIGTWDWDIRGGSLDWDARAKEIAGLPPDAPVSYEVFVRTIHPEDRGRVQGAVDACLASGADYQAEYRAVRASGEVRWVSVRGGLIRDAGGRPVRMVGVAADITERREYEAALVRAEAAEAAQRATSGFMAVASHELHTPLNAILGYADLLLDGLEGPLNPAQRASLERLSASGRRLGRVAEAVLDLSRLRAGTLELDRVEFELRATLDACLGPHENRARQKGLGFSRAVDPDVPDLLRGDPGRLCQALSALLDNAVKFTEEGTVTCTVLREGPLGGRECLRFEVTDTGIGIRPEDQGRIFEAFEQVEPADTHSCEGLGLGLAICASLAARMGGRAWAESEPGRGSSFSFTACVERVE